MLVFYDIRSHIQRAILHNLKRVKTGPFSLEKLAQSKIKSQSAPHGPCDWSETNRTRFLRGVHPRVYPYMSTVLGFQTVFLFLFSFPKHLPFSAPLCFTAAGPALLHIGFLPSSLTLLEPQSHFEDKPLKFQVICPQNGTAVLKGLINLPPASHPVQPLSAPGYQPITS